MAGSASTVMLMAAMTKRTSGGTVVVCAVDATGRCMVTVCVCVCVCLCVFVCDV
mgnify:CR=1 FL=1